MDKFMQQMREAFANEALWKEFQTGIWDTIYSTVAATLVACVLGIILGIILVAGEEDGVRPLPGPVMKVLNFAINILRSVPFLIPPNRIKNDTASVTSAIDVALS